MKKNLDRELNRLYMFDLKKSKRKVVSIKENIEIDYKKELVKAEKKYNERKGKLGKYFKDLDYYSTFKLHIIGPYIANMFTLYKGEEYCYNYEWKEFPNSTPTMKVFVQSATNKRKKVYFEWKFFEVEKNITFYKFLSSEETIHEHYLFKYWC